MCLLCGANFDDKNLMESHEAEHVDKADSMTKNMKIRCDFCELEAYDTEIINEHAFKEHGSIVLNCTHCDFGALDQTILNKHMHKHTGRILFTCGKCEFEATKKYLLESHVESKHTKKEDVQQV